MPGGEVEITGAFPSGVIGTTAENLKDAASGENHEWTDMYPSFAKIAQEEGFKNIAKVFDAIAIAEKQHEKRFLDLAKNIAADKVFKKDTPVTWRCINCGYIHEGTDAPNVCPACAHPQAHFEMHKDNY